MARSKDNPTPVVPGIGEKIKKIRELRGMLQYELAKKIKVNQSAISQWENGITDITLLNLCKVAKALKVSPVRFMPKSLGFLGKSPCKTNKRDS